MFRRTIAKIYFWSIDVVKIPYDFILLKAPIIIANYHRKIVRGKPEERKEVVLEGLSFLCVFLVFISLFFLLIEHHFNIDIGLKNIAIWSGRLSITVLLVLCYLKASGFAEFIENLFVYVICGILLIGIIPYIIGLNILFYVSRLLLWIISAPFVYFFEISEKDRFKNVSDNEVTNKIAKKTRLSTS
jgi:hypothetical protein